MEPVFVPNCDVLIVVMEVGLGSLSLKTACAHHRLAKGQGVFAFIRLLCRGSEFADEGLTQ